MILGRKVLRAIAEIQLKALHNLYEHKDDIDKSLIFRYIESCSEDYSFSINRAIDLYQQIYNSRFIENHIKLLSEYQLGICIHILFRMEDQWVQTYSQREVNAAWKIIFEAQEKFHPEYVIHTSYEKIKE